MTNKSLDPSQIPWYRQFWPWFIIAIPSAAVVGGMITLWLALSHPETLVVDEGEYQRIRDEMRAQDHGDTEEQTRADGQQ